MPDARAPTYAQPCTDHRDEKCFLDHFLLLDESAVRLRHPAQIPFGEAVTQVLILGLGLWPNIDCEGHCQAIADVRAGHSATSHVVLLFKLNLLLVYGLWKVRANTTAAFTMWIGRTLNSNLQHAIVAPGTVPGTIEPWLKRLQFDMIYAF